jgi:hypothetical protein
MSRTIRQHQPALDQRSHLRRSRIMSFHHRRSGHLFECSSRNETHGCLTPSTQCISPRMTVGKRLSFFRSTSALSLRSKSCHTSSFMLDVNHSRVLFRHFSDRSPRRSGGSGGGESEHRDRTRHGRTMSRPAATSHWRGNEYLTEYRYCRHILRLISCVRIVCTHRGRCISLSLHGRWRCCLMRRTGRSRYRK